MHTSWRVAFTALCLLIIFGAAYWFREVFVLECTRAGNTAPACELIVAKRGETRITPIESGALTGAEVKHRRVYDNDGSVTDHFYLSVITSRGPVVSSSGNSRTNVSTAAAQINTFVEDASAQNLRVALDNWLICYGIAALMSLFIAAIIHKMRH